jgi:serine/threonine protein kinase
MTGMKHEMLGRLGEGSYGTVFRAVSNATNRLVALKLLKRCEEDPGVAQRIRHEIMSQARLEHPNIVKVYDAGDHPDGRHYIEMQLVDGYTLSTRASHEHLRDPEVAAQLIATVAFAVDFAHEQGVVHCDLKPANILIDRHTHAPLVTDFGISQLLYFDTPAEPVGTLPYMAPEQCQVQPDGQLVTNRWTDVYALGAILYELVTGKPPYCEAKTLEQRQQLMAAGTMPLAPSQMPEPRYSIGRKPDRELDQIVLGALAIHRHARYPTAAALARDLDRWVHEQPVHGPGHKEPTWWQTCARFGRRNWRLLGAALMPILVWLVVSLIIGFGLIDRNEHTALGTNRIIAELVGRNLDSAIREAKSGIVALANDPYIVNILRERLPAALQGSEVETESWTRLMTALKKSGADQFYLLNTDGCIVRYWPAPAPPNVYERWYGFRHYFECGMQARAFGRDACLARVYKSEYDYYANTLRSAVSAPVYGGDGERDLLGVVVASWPADRTLGGITLGQITDTNAATSLLLLRDLDRPQADQQLGPLETPVCGAHAPEQPAGLSSAEELFARLNRGGNSIAFPRNGLGGESLLPSATAQTILDSPLTLAHYRDPRDGIAYLAAFSRTGIPELRAAVGGSKVEATPIIVAARRREELDAEVWKIALFCLGLWVVTFILANFFVRSLARHDEAKIRGRRRT